MIKESNPSRTYDQNFCRYILGMRVDYTTFELATEKIIQLALNESGGYVCIGTVHMVMESFDDPEFKKIVNYADIVTPDGMPLVWGLKLLGIKDAQRVYGPALTPYVCERASKLGIPVGFYGGTEEVLEKMIKNLRSKFPELNVAYAFSPPFRPLTEEEDKKVVDDINNSGAKILFVGLGCPKQERWMAEHRDKIKAVMIGVGAAFDFIAGDKPQAPRWMQNIGLEWLFRLLTEPKRLWKRYLYNNPRFIYHFGKEILKKYLNSNKTREKK
jgi:N-acetylglucosaminyldiphosphoundecaprenol N-acetyl-beta-D-mannosaminyltransferase